MNDSRHKQMCACLAYEAISRRIAASSSLATVDIKSTVEHVDLQVGGERTDAVHIYSIETDYLELTDIDGSTLHHFSISVRVDGLHYVADVFLGARGAARWNGEIVEFQNGLPLRSFHTTVASAPW